MAKFFLAAAFSKIGNHSGAVKAFTEYLRLEPASPQALYFRARLHAKLGNMYVVVDPSLSPNPLPSLVHSTVSHTRSVCSGMTRSKTSAAHCAMTQVALLHSLGVPLLW